MACQPTRECADIPTDPEWSSIHFYEFPAVRERSRVTNDAIRRIERCYSKNPFEAEKYTLILESVRQNSEGQNVVIFEFYGIEDLRVAYVIDAAGEVLGAHRFSAID
jgi:hypothetical protein